MHDDVFGLDSVPIVDFLPVAEAGFPDVVSPVIFTPLCNFMCRYCLNRDVVLSKTNKRIPIERVLAYLKENHEESILISGGEPCMWEGIFNLAKTFHDAGYKVRLSTNGSFPSRLKQMVNDGVVSFVAMDIKTSLDNTDSLNEIMLNPHQVIGIRESIDFLNSQNGTIGVEFRTTLDPRYVSESDIEYISKLINPDAVWVLQQFRARDNLLGGPEMAFVQPYNQEVLDSLMAIAKRRVKNVFFRWP